MLDESIFFQTYREEPANDTFNFKYNKETFQVGNGKFKAEFYNEQNIDPWNNVRKIRLMRKNVATVAIIRRMRN